MKTISNKFYLVISFLIAISVSFTSCTSSLSDKSTAKSERDPKKIEAIKEITALSNSSNMNSGGIKSILEIAKKDTTNFESYIHLAKLAGEFGYHTGALVEIAGYVYQAKVESDYFKQLGDLAVMKRGGTPSVVLLAWQTSEITSKKNARIEKGIQKLRQSAEYKTIDEARVFNKSMIEKQNKDSKQSN